MMEWIRRMVFFGLGFAASVSFVVMDDRMAMQYGYDSIWDREGGEKVVSQVMASLPWREEEPLNLEALEVFLTQKM